VFAPPGGAGRGLEALALPPGLGRKPHFLSFLWEGSAGQRLVVAVNYGPTQGQCYVSLPLPDLREKAWLLRDLLSGVRYERGGNDLASRGLYVDIPEWQYHVFELKPC
jgi:hypothetical protein